MPNIQNAESCCVGSLYRKPWMLIAGKH